MKMYASLISVGKKFKDPDIQAIGIELEANCVNSSCEYWNPYAQCSCTGNMKMWNLYIPDLFPQMKALITKLTQALEELTE